MSKSWHVCEQEEKASLQTAAAQAAAAAAEEQAAFSQRIEAAEAHLKETAGKLAAAEVAVAEGTEAKAAVDQELQEHLEYTDSIEGSISLCNSCMHNLPNRRACKSSISSTLHQLKLINQYVM